MSNKVLDEIVLNNTRREKSLMRYATKSRQAKRENKEKYPDRSNIRPAFFHDADRIIHSRAYTRYIDKTQVFFLFENDHITHRALHVQMVAKIARSIGRCLKLNEDLIEAIALGHDLGHCPYGHDGETALNSLCREHKIGAFCHSAQSVRLLTELENGGKGLNLCLQVLDGILCHNGEMLCRRYEPAKTKSWIDHSREYKQCMKDDEYAKKIFPMTLEGCVVRISDVLAYIGRDIEDAITIKLITREDIPKAIRNVLGDTNRSIIDALAVDLIKNSYGNPFLEFTEDIFKALKDLKTFNYEQIYQNPATHSELSKVGNMFNQLFNSYCRHIRESDQTSEIWPYFLNSMNGNYTEKTSIERRVIDFMSGMTDDFFNNQFRDLFFPKNYGYSVEP